MTHRIFIAGACTAAVGALSLGSAAWAHGANSRASARGGDVRADAAGLVFVQTNEPSGNRIVVFQRRADGRLTPGASYATGGNGGAAAPGTQSDHLASQGSLAYDPGRGLLVAVNAGSNTVSSFRVSGGRLHLTGIVPAGGDFPASVTIHGSLVYVLDSGGSGSVHGFTVRDGRLVPLAGSGRTLGLSNDNPPFFLNSPGEVGFTPDGGQLIVTTKGSGSAIDVFSVGADGRLSADAVRNLSATPVPFAFTFTPGGRLAVGEAAVSAVSTYRLASDGHLADAKSETDHQTALCWIQRVGRFYYVSNTGSNTIAAFEISGAGQPSLVAGGVVASTPAGPIDLTSPAGTRLLYAETGGGTVQEFRVKDSGALARIGEVHGLPVGIEGIASS